MNRKILFITLIFALSVVATSSAQMRAFGECEDLDKKYAQAISSNKTDTDFLQKALEEYSESCMGSETHYKIAKSLQEQSPTYLSSLVCGFYTYNKIGRAKIALSYYEKATELTAEKDKRSNVLLTMAEIYARDLKNFQQARIYAEKSIAENPQSIEAYSLLAELYAESTISKDTVTDKAKYWLAFDMLQRAIEQAPESICTEKLYFKSKEYIAHFPTKAEISAHKDMREGKAYRIGGWIGRSTICRSMENEIDKY